MPVIDTSWLIALFNAEDAHHQKTVAVAEEPGRYLIPHVILNEFLSVIHHRTDAPTARRLLQEIRADPAFRVIPECDVDHIDAMYRARRTLSYADCVAASVAITMNEPLLTFDEKQARAVRSKKD